MKMNLKYVIFFVALLITLVSVASAADIQDQPVSDVTTSTVSQGAHSASDTQVFTSNNNKDEIKNAQTVTNVTKKENNKQTKLTQSVGNLGNNIIESTEPKTIVVTQDNVDEIFGGESYTLSDDVNEGDTLNFQGLIDKEHSLVINKPITVISSTKDAVINLHTEEVSGSNPEKCFVINNGASGSIISGLHLQNTECWVFNVYNTTLYNMTMHVKDARIGSGVGQTALRYCNNVTIDNCHIYTENNGGSATFVLTACNNCTIVNSTVEGQGNTGNILFVGNPYNTGDKPAGYEITNFDNRVINSTFTTSYSYANLLQNMATRTLIQGNKFYSGSNVQAGTNGTLIDNEFYSTVSVNMAANCVAHGNIHYGTGSATINANAQVYNNTLYTTTISGAGVLFENNTIKGGLTVNQPTNVENNNLYDVQVNSNGRNSNITNNNVTGTITSAATNVVIDSNNITTTNDNTIVVTGATNNVTHNILYTRTKAGVVTLKVRDDTTVEANTPESGEVFVLTDETYSTFFDNNGNLINTNVKNYSTLILNGTFNDKIFKFDDIILSVNGDQAVINNGYISTENDAIIALENVVFNNTKEGIQNSVLLNTDGNLVRNVKVYRTSNSGISREIMVNSDKNIIISNTFDLSIPAEIIDYSEYPFSMANNSAISVTGSENTINSNSITIRNTTNGFGTISVIDLASRTKSMYNTVNSNTIVVEGSGYIYGVNLGANTEKNTINSNNIKLTSDVYTAGIQIGYSPAQNNTINSNTITLTSPIAYGVLASASGGNVTGTTVNSNRVYISANQGVGIELCGSTPETIKNTTIQGNTVVVDGNYSMGIAVAGSDIRLLTNTITVTGTTNDTDGTSYDIIKPTTAGLIMFNSENIESYNNTITAVNGANIILNGTSNSKVISTLDNKARYINAENNANIVLHNSNNNIIDTQKSYTNNHYAIILISSSNNNITHNILNASNINGGDDAVIMDENSVGNYFYNNTPSFVLLTDETYSTLFDENGVYKFPAGVDLSLAGDLHDKDLIFTNNVTFVNGGNYTIYNGSIIIKDVDGRRYDNRFVNIFDININNTNKQALIDNTSTTQQRNIQFYGGSITVNGDDIVAIESVKSPITYAVVDIQYATIITNGTNVLVAKMTRDSYTQNDYLYLKYCNFTSTATGKNKIVEVSNVNIDILNNNITMTGGNVTIFDGDNVFANAEFFMDNNINVTGDNINLIILNSGRGSDPTIGDNKIYASSSNPVKIVEITNTGNSYVGQGRYSYAYYNYPNTIIVDAENGEVPLINIPQNGYVRNNFIMSKDLYGNEAVNATTLSNNTPTKPTINLTAPEQARVLDEITINVTVENATTTYGMILLKINDINVANSTGDTLTYTHIPVTNETLNITAEYVYNNAGFTSSTDNAIVTLEKLDDTITLDVNRPFLNENLTITGTLTDETGVAINNRTVTIDVNGNKVNVTTDSEGNYNYITTPIEGNNTITVNFDGESVYISKEETKTVFVVDLEKYLQVDDLNQTVQDFNKTIQEQNQTINDLNKNIQEQTDKINELNNNLTEANNKIDEQNKSIQNLTQQVADAMANIESLTNTVNDLINKNKELEEIIKEMNKTTPKLNTTITIDNVNAKVGEITTITAYIKDQNGEPITSGKAIFKINGITLKDENKNTIYAYITNGTASIKYKVPMGWIKNTTTIQVV